MKGLTITLIIILVAFIEILLIKNPAIGLTIYLLFLITTCFILSKNEKLTDFDKLLTLFLIIPLIKILQLFVTLPQPWKAFVGYTTLLVLGIYYLIWFKIPLKLKDNYPIIPLVLILGGLMGFLGRFFFQNSNKFPISPLFPLSTILLIITIVISEELFFRGLLQESSKSVLGIAPAILLPAFFYGLLHLSLGFPAFSYFLLLSLTSGLIYHSTRNLSLSILFALATNLIFLAPL